MSQTRLQLRQALAERVMRFVSGTADSGSTVALSDSENLEDSGASTGLWEGAWLHIHTGANAGETRRVTAYDPVGGSLTINRPFGVAIDATSQYELHRLLSPERLHRAINATMQRCWYRTAAVVTVLADGDMEDAGTASWTATNASLAKVAASHGSLAGVQALEVTNSAAGGFAAAQTLATLEGQQYQLEASAAPGGRTAELRVWNVTAGAVIASQSADGVAWRPLRSAFAIPTGCDEIEIRLGGAEADAVITWDNLVLTRTGRRQYALPDWITRRQQVVEVWQRRADGPGEDILQAAEWWRIVAGPTASGSPFWLEVAAAPAPGHIFVIEALRPYAALATDASTTTAPVEWIVQGALVEAYRELKRDAPAADVARYAALQREAAEEFQRLSRLFQPRVTRRVMLTGWT